MIGFIYAANAEEAVESLVRVLTISWAAFIGGLVVLGIVYLLRLFEICKTGHTKIYDEFEFGEGLKVGVLTTVIMATMIFGVLAILFSIGYGVYNLLCLIGQ